MDISAASISMSQNRLQEEVAARVESMSLDAVKGQSAALAKLMESARIITDPRLGNNVDFSA